RGCRGPYDFDGSYRLRDPKRNGTGPPASECVALRYLFSGRNCSTAIPLFLGGLRSRVQTSRRYRGITPAERQAERRGRLVGGRVEMVGAGGDGRASGRAAARAAPPHVPAFLRAVLSQEGHQV